MKQLIIRQVGWWITRAIPLSLHGSKIYRVLVLILLVASTPVHSADSDEKCVQEFTPIIEALNVVDMSNAFNNRPTNDVCSRSMLKLIQLDFTNEVANRARQYLQNSNTPERASDWLDQFSSVELGLPLAKSWQVNFARGEIAAAMGNKKEAAEQFEIAYKLSLSSSENTNSVVRPASAQQQDFLYLRANEARHLYGDLSGAISRSGEASVATLGARGAVQRQASPLPIEFETESAVIKPLGMNNVNLIVAYIRKQEIKELEVIGHTDWRGASDYNLNLSVRRAKAVAEAIQDKYIEKHGGSLQISISGRGEECPRVISQIDQFTVDDAAALYRRVSLGWPRQGRSTLSECDDYGVRSEEEARARLLAK